MIEKLTLATVPLLLMGGLFGSIAAGANLEVGAPVAESRFGPDAPPDWQLEGTWDLSPVGATAGPDSRARSSQDLPKSCLIEMIFDLPATERIRSEGKGTAISRNALPLTSNRHSPSSRVIPSDTVRPAQPWAPCSSSVELVRLWSPPDPPRRMVGRMSPLMLTLTGFPSLSVPESEIL